MSADSTHRFVLETANDVSRLICGDCRRPFAEVRGGEVTIDSKHGAQIHTNALTLNHLKMIAVEMFRQQNPPGRW